MNVKCDFLEITSQSKRIWHTDHVTADGRHLGSAPALIQGQVYRQEDLLWLAGFLMHSLLPSGAHSEAGELGPSSDQSPISSQFIYTHSNGHLTMCIRSENCVTGRFHHVTAPQRVLNPAGRQVTEQCNFTGPLWYVCVSHHCLKHRGVVYMAVLCFVFLQVK